jgi:hypothetical protein
VNHVNYLNYNVTPNPYYTFIFAQLITLNYHQMRKINLFLGIAFIALTVVSCKNEKETKAQKSIDTYIVYVDSLGNLDRVLLQTNWSDIDASYQTKTSEAEIALQDLIDKEKAEKDIQASKEKYEALRAEMAATSVANAKQRVRNHLFGEGKISDDMNFSWVNKDNILGVYQQFVDAAEKNKDSYSREDWDEIKLMYETLDSRKNTVENEGLTTADNRKIAGLKLKFAPLLTVKRIDAKSTEMEKAKE